MARIDSGLSRNRNPRTCGSLRPGVNLSFSGDVTVARKHTRFIGRDLDRLIYFAVGKLADLRQKQLVRFAAYKGRELSDVEAHDLIVRALLAHIISWEAVTKVVGEWRKPAHDEFAPRNV